MQSGSEQTKDRAKHSRVGVWFYIFGMAVFAIGMPSVASGGVMSTFEELEVELPELTRLALQFSSCIRKAPVFAFWAGFVLVSSIPGFLVRGPRINRLYICGGLSPLLLFAVLAWSVQSTAANVQHALSD